MTRPSPLSPVLTRLRRGVRRGLVIGLGVFTLCVLLPIGLRAGAYWLGSEGDRRGWATADRSSAGLLPAPADHPEALISVMAARTVGWRGVFAVHSWVVVKEAGADAYTRFDKVGWGGGTIRTNGYAPDGRWFGAAPEEIVRLTGPDAAALIPRIRAAVASYPFADWGEYRAWPGPNSNSFVAWILKEVPEIDASLPPTAIGKDYPLDGSPVGLTPSGTGVQVSLGGVAGLSLGWVEGVEINLFGAVLGVDFRSPAIKLPGIGRIGF